MTPTTPADPVLRAEGLAVAVPPGWEVRVFRRVAEAAETTHAVLHAATFALPADRGDYGDGAVQLMGPSDVFVALVEFHPSSTASPLFASRGIPGPLTAADFSRTSLQVALAGQAGVQRWFTSAGRAWCLYVVLGGWDGRAPLAGRANDLVRGLEVHAA